MEKKVAFQQEFKGANIKTPFEKMRARAIIFAGLDAEGLSLINFNLGAFLNYNKKQDGIMILKFWATQPIKEQTNKFHAHPEAGQKALYKRVDLLTENLKQRKDLPKGFLETATTEMKNAIECEIQTLRPSQSA